MVTTPASAGTSANNNASRGTPSNNLSQTNGISTSGLSSKYPTYAANIPVSMRRAPPLDMNTVERKGHPLGVREATKRTRPHGLQEAPTFRPTAEEFRDPNEYIRKIAPEARKYGICKIIPPDSWSPPFAIDTEKFHFRTRKQELNSVEGSTRTNLNYLDQLAKFHKQHGMNLNRFPSVDKRPLDLYKLKKAVETRGGFEKVCKLKKWAEIGRDLGYSGKIMSSLSTSLKNSYGKWLQPYEDYLKLAKPGVQQQLEFEYGGPMTPSPANSPMKRSHQPTPGSSHGDSPAMRASVALNSTLKASEDAERQTPEQPRPAPSGFTAVNSGGFTPVNTGSSGLPAGGQINMIVKKEPSASTPQHYATSAKSTPDARDSPHLSVNGNSNHLKRTMSHESLNGTGSGTDSPANGDSDGNRRSKRQRKDAPPTVAGSHMSLLRPLAPRMSGGPKFGPPKPGDPKPGERCEGCGNAEQQGNLIICDSCDNGYHRNCMDPPATKISSTDWHCPKCLVGTGEFGFEEGGIYGLKHFQEKARHFKESYFDPKMPFDPVLNKKRPVSEDDVEREFWRLVESLTETVEVEYGADIHSTTHGSGFPDPETSPLDAYSTDPWNLNILPLYGESLFKHIKSDISGMTVPWLYVGMCFSTFCWHNEDHYTYSANYQHFGATKTWYGIPGDCAENFEQAMRNAVPELFEQQPDLLFQLVTLLPPDQLKKANVEVYALDQRAGQFVITFPQAYHAGFNHGFNFNEAVNFAPSDWEPFGQAGVQRLQDFRRQPCFSHDELLMTAAARDLTIKSAKWLGPALTRMQDRELEQRKSFLTRHQEFEDHHCKVEESPGAQNSSDCALGFEKDDQDLQEEEYQCAFCKSFTFVSRYQCTKTGKVMCMLHAGVYDCCGASEEQRHRSADHVLRYRFSDEALKTLVQKVVEKARMPEAWLEKRDEVLDNEPRPALKVLKSLVSEGSKIAYDLPGLIDMRNFVEQCDDWISRATDYTTRKQQTRRKTDPVWKSRTSRRNTENEDKEKEKEKEKEKDNRSAHYIKVLLQEAEELPFDCPEITILRERQDEISEFQKNALSVLQYPSYRSPKELDDLIELGRGFNMDIPELDSLEGKVKQVKWFDTCSTMRSSTELTLDSLDSFMNEGISLGIPVANEHMNYWRAMKARGEIWEEKANELIKADTIHYHQLEALSGQAAQLPVTQKTRAAVDNILAKQREAHKQIVTMLEKSKDEDFHNRPKYEAVRDIFKSLEEFNSKPSGTLDLEKELKRHEDWMRVGKKLFGKANAPLPILLQHMRLVRDRNENCLDLHDKPRMPVEPSSRAQSMEDGEMNDDRDVFCLCRQPEAGMMIECELCHEWYHSRCLKIARGKIKEDDKYTCPICDYRVKIPRDAARPKLENLCNWQDQIAHLPFQPEEEEVLQEIIDTAQEFRNFLHPYCSEIVSTPEEVSTQRFYLRKIEGADILLAHETNFFRQQLHKWAPVAPDPPPVLEQSLSTRKPRPTKQQKMMNERGLTDPNDLPSTLRTKPHVFKSRKSNDPPKPPPALQPAPQFKTGSGTPPSKTGVAGSPSTPDFRGSMSGADPMYGQMFSTTIPPQVVAPSDFTTSPNFPFQSRGDRPPSPSLPRSPLFRPATPPPGSAGPVDPALFSPSAFAAAALRESARNHTGSLISPGRDAHGHNRSSSGGNMDSFFAEYTNEDEPPSRNEAGEALEGLGVNNSSSQAGDDEHDRKLADEFLAKDD